MPTDVEMETLAQTWSEHCKHKIFNALIAYEEDGKRLNIDSLFKTYIVGSTE
jgi:phosphoribosylformylglycinamidine synthase